MWKLLRNLILLGLLTVGGLKLLLWFLSAQQIDRIAAQLAPMAKIAYQTVSVSLSGEIKIGSMTATVATGSLRGVWSAEQVRVQTPGAWWLIKRALFRESAIPENLGITLQGLKSPISELQIPGIDAEWLSGASWVPFETIGCGVVKRFATRDYQQMGLFVGVPTQHADYRYDAQTQTLEVNLAFDTPPLSAVTLHAELSQWSPAVLTDAAAAQKMRVTRAALSYADNGYLQQRNRFCAQHMNISAQQFSEQHIAALIESLKQHRVEAGSEILNLYRRLMSNGGLVEFSSLPNAAVPPVQYNQRDAAEILRLLNLTARFNEAPPIMVRLAFLPPDPGAEVAGDTPVVTPPATIASPPPATSAVASLPSTAAIAATPTNAPATKPAASPTAPSVAKTGDPPPVIAKPTPAVAAEIPLTNVIGAKSPPTSKPAPVAPKSAPEPAKPANAPPAVAANSVGKPSTNANVASGEKIPSSAPAPPPNSTLALVWEKPKIERLPPRGEKALDYDILQYPALSQQIGRRLRFITEGGKEIEGDLQAVDETGVELRVKGVGGGAQYHIPKARIEQIRLPHQQPRRS